MPKTVTITLKLRDATTSAQFVLGCRAQAAKMEFVATSPLLSPAAARDEAAEQASLFDAVAQQVEEGVR